MFIDDAELFRRADAYCKSRKIRVHGKEKLGHGSDGSVWRTSRPSAVKALQAQKTYQNEVECYKRLAADHIQELCGLHVPLMEGFDDDLMVIEMSIVTPPYLLDFGKVSIDTPPPYYFDHQLVANSEAEGRDLFGSLWSEVQPVLYALRKRFGIYYADPRPGKINFGREDDDDDWQREPPIDYSDYE